MGKDGVLMSFSIAAIPVGGYKSGSSSDLDIGGEVTVGSAWSGKDVTFYSGTSGDQLLWDASDEKLVITGTDGANALEVADGNVAITDNLTVSGNFTVSGTSTTIDTTTLTVTDPLIKLAHGTTASPANDLGIIFTRGNGSASNIANRGIIWDESADEFAFAFTNDEAGTTTGNVDIDDYADIRGGKVTVDDAIELGHASDTTIARSGSGAITVEGTQVLLAGAQTGITTILNAATKIGRDSDNLVDFATTDNKIIFRVEGVNEVELVQNALSPVTSNGVALGTGSLMWSDLFLAGSAHFDSSPSDETVSGITATFTAGENLSRGEVVYFKASDSKMWKAVASASGTMPVVAMAAADISADATGTFLLQGFLADNGTFPAYTVGGTIYAPEAETSSENVPEQAAPDSDGDFVQVLGFAVTANSVYFDPSNDVIEHA